MAFSSYTGVGVTALAGAVPHTVIDNYRYTDYFPADQVREVVDKVGIYERPFRRQGHVLLRPLFRGGSETY